MKTSFGASMYGGRRDTIRRSMVASATVTGLHPSTNTTAVGG